jgi:hypothetical protein
MITGFLLGVIVTGSVTAAAFFYRFWMQTRDKLFLAFAVAFMVEAVNRMAFLWLENPHEGTPAIYLVRLLSYLMILGGIVLKNRG